LRIPLDRDLGGGSSLQSPHLFFLRWNSSHFANRNGRAPVADHVWCLWWYFAVCRWICRRVFQSARARFV
jgi:hypothetical protein